MRKLLFTMLLMMMAMTSQAINLNGKYISQSGELMFTFTKDSLYVDMARSGCGISAFKLKRTFNNERLSTYNAYETYLEDDKPTYRQVLIKIWKLKRNRFKIEYYGKDKDRSYNSNEFYTISKYNK